MEECGEDVDQDNNGKGEDGDESSNLAGGGTGEVVMTTMRGLVVAHAR